MVFYYRRTPLGGGLPPGGSPSRRLFFGSLFCWVPVSVRPCFRTMGIKIALRLPDRLRRFLALWTPSGIPLLRKFQILLSYPMRSKNSPNCHIQRGDLAFPSPNRRAAPPTGPARDAASSCVRGFARFRRLAAPWALRGRARRSSARLLGGRLLPSWHGPP